MLCCTTCMQKFLPYLSLFLALVVGFSLLIAPHAVDAKAKKQVIRKPVRYAYDLYNPRRRYGDEKVDIKNTSSRCNTPAMRKLHVQNLERAKGDGKPFGLTFESVSTTETLSGIGEAYKKYLNGLSLAWGAMEEPYCGFGAFGMTAARKSYDKSVARIRARFVEAAKPFKTAAIANDKPAN